MNIYLELKKKIRSVIHQMQREGVLPSQISHNDFRVEPPLDRRHGDIVCNVAMVFSKAAGVKPRELAILFLSKLEDEPIIEQIDIAGHGFLNFHLKDEFWLYFLSSFLEQFSEDGIQLPADGDAVAICTPFDLASKQNISPMFRAFHHTQAIINIYEAAGYKVITSESDNRENVEQNMQLSLCFDDPGLNKAIRYGDVQLKQGKEAIKMPENMMADFYDSLSFMLLSHKTEANIELDIDKVVEQSIENPHFYVQYTHAQIFSVFRNTHLPFWQIENFIKKIINVNAQAHDLKTEISLLKKLAEYSWHIHRSCVTIETQCVAVFLYGLARDFHAIWSPGKEVPQLRFNKEDEREYDIVHFALLKAVAIVLSSGLRMLGVKPITEMR